MTARKEHPGEAVYPRDHLSIIRHEQRFRDFMRELIKSIVLKGNLTCFANIIYKYSFVNPDRTGICAGFGALFPITVFRVCIVAKIFVSEIQPNQEIASAFAVAEKQLRTARNGTSFLTLKLTDKTGEITGRIWERASESFDSIPARRVVFVRGRSETYRDELQLNILDFHPVKTADIDPYDFLPVSPSDPGALLDRLKALVSGIKDKACGQLLKSLFKDRILVNRFRTAPAAKSMHHACLGGLLEHTAAVTELAARIADLYPFLDRDLLITGAILHDIGKIDEFVYDLCIDYSDEGRLLGHMVLGVNIIEEKLRGLKNFPSEKALLLKHLVLSHHGEAEFGAVKVPMTREAFVLNFADDLDAKMNALTRMIAEPKGDDKAWTAYQPIFNRFFFRGSSPEAGAKKGNRSNEADEAEKGVQLNLWDRMASNGKPDA